MPQFQLKHMQVSLVFLLIFFMLGCHQYIDYLPKPQPKPTACRLQSFSFNQPNGTIDSNVYTFSTDGRITSFRRMGRAPNGTITAIRSGELFYNAQGRLERVDYPMTGGVLRLMYNNNGHLLRLEYSEGSELLQAYDITTNAKGNITSMTGRGLNNTRMVYVVNEQGYVTKMERYDQAGNRLILTYNEDFDPNVRHHIPDVYPGIPVWLQNSIATLSFDPQIMNNGPWRSSTTFSAIDAQGNYSGVIREVKSTASFITTREGYIYQRNFTNTAGAGGSANYRYTNCQP